MNLSLSKSTQGITLVVYLNGNVRLKNPLHIFLFGSKALSQASYLDYLTYYQRNARPNNNQLITYYLPVCYILRIQQYPVITTYNIIVHLVPQL